MTEDRRRPSLCVGQAGSFAPMLRTGCNDAQEAFPVPSPKDPRTGVRGKLRTGWGQVPAGVPQGCGINWGQVCGSKRFNYTQRAWTGILSGARSAEGCINGEVKPAIFIRAVKNTQDRLIPRLLRCARNDINWEWGQGQSTRFVPEERRPRRPPDRQTGDKPRIKCPAVGSAG